MEGYGKRRLSVGDCRSEVRNSDGREVDRGEREERDGDGVARLAGRLREGGEGN